MPKAGEAHSSSSDADSLPDLSPADSHAISLEFPESACSAIMCAEPVQDAECIHAAPLQGGIGSCSDEERLSVSLKSDKEMVRQHVCDMGVDPSHGGVTREEQAWDLQHSDTLDQGFQGDDVKPGYGIEPGCGFENANTSRLGISVHGDTEMGHGVAKENQQDGGEEGLNEFCRVCHLSVEKSHASSELIKLGCACKSDLALAHRVCAETWFKIKGNWVCEICGSTAQNISGSGDADFTAQSNDVETNNVALNHAERCWQNQPFCNIVLVCVLLVLIASWLFRVTLF